MPTNVHHNMRKKNHFVSLKKTQQLKYLFLRKFLSINLRNATSVGISLCLSFVEGRDTVDGSRGRNVLVAWGDVTVTGYIMIGTVGTLTIRIGTISYCLAVGVGCNYGCRPEKVFWNFGYYGKISPDLMEQIWNKGCFIVYT